MANRSQSCLLFCLTPYTIATVRELAGMTKERYKDDSSSYWLRTYSALSPISPLTLYMLARLRGAFREVDSQM